MKKESLIGQQLLAHLQRGNLTIYQAAKKVALANDESFHAASMRLHRLIENPNNFLLALESSLAALGLEPRLVESETEAESEEEPGVPA